MSRHFTPSSSRDKDADRYKKGASERITADVDAFLQRGGTIEVLGTTRTLTRLETPIEGAHVDATSATPAAKPARAAR